MRLGRRALRSVLSSTARVSIVGRPSLHRFAAALLDHVRQLVSHQLAVVGRLPGSQPDVIAVRESLRTQMGGISCIGRAVMHPHTGQVRTQRPFHFSLHAFRQRLASAGRLDPRFHAGGRGLVIISMSGCTPLQFFFTCTAGSCTMLLRLLVVLL